MLDAIMTHIKNHFACTVESFTYEIVSDGIVGSFSEEYVDTQYIWLRGTKVNDGVYKITSATTTKLTVEETLVPEPNAKKRLAAVFGLAPPKDFLTVATEIEGYTSKDGVVSESIDDYSVSYGGTGGGDGSWASVFHNKLSPWRRMYDDDYTMLRNYDITTKGWYK